MLGKEDSKFEKELQEELKVTTRCMPLNTKGEGKCFITGEPTNTKVIFAKSY